MAKNKGNAFRVFPKALYNAYKTGNIDVIPNLEGFNFNQGENVVNTCTYDPGKKYLHFFSDFHDAETYLEDMEELKPGIEFCICAFRFDDAFLAQNKYQGRYYSYAEGKEVFRDEYILTTDNYNAAENFIGLATSGEYKEKGRVNYDPDSYGWFF